LRYKADELYIKNSSASNSYDNTNNTTSASSSSHKNMKEISSFCEENDEKKKYQQNNENLSKKYVNIINSIIKKPENIEKFQKAYYVKKNEEKTEENKNDNISS